MRQAVDDNRPRFVCSERGHTESWFLRANHPTEPKALWLKATVLRRDDGEADADAWCSLFDGERTVAVKETVPLSEAHFRDGRMIDVGASHFELDDDGGRLEGKLESERGKLEWNLSFTRSAGLGDNWCLLPSRRLVDAAFPKNKLLTPTALARFDGNVTWDGEDWPVDGWWGMQGHNWGAGHAPAYAWGHCVFVDAHGEPFCVVEGASGKLKLGKRMSPFISLLSVRHGGHEYRFDKLVDLWRQKPHVDFPEWTLRIRGSSGEASITMRADPDRMVCLGYENPDRQLSYCLNSKTAAVTLRVNPVNEEAFECISECGGALEFLQTTLEPRVGPVC